MIRRRPGRVTGVVASRDGVQQLEVEVGGRPRPALNYTPLTGPVAAGDRVVLNTTATHLGLGSGGYDFVMGVAGREASELAGPGHLVKLRYTPWQLRILAVEEAASPHHRTLRQARDLAGMPVVVCALHSQLAPVVAALRDAWPEDSPRIAYVMTDGGALPASFSETAWRLRQRGWLQAVITAGHAFGGDHEAINTYSALLAARWVVEADVAVCAMGPGHAGTGTPLGFSGAALAAVLDGAVRLGGRAVAVPRLSFADPRRRHRGLSHHSRTILLELVGEELWVPLPCLPAGLQRQLRQDAAALAARHRVIWLDGPGLRRPLEQLAAAGIEARSMGRTPDQDPHFFRAAAAAGRLAACLARSDRTSRAAVEEGR